MNIVTIFSGRKENIKILSKYLKNALDMNIINEVHFWNNARNQLDEEYLKSISNVRRTSSSGAGNYIQINTPIINNSFQLNIKSSNDIHVKIKNENLEYEIVLGGWKNTKTVVREIKDNYINEIFTLEQNGITDGNIYNMFDFLIKDDILIIKKNNEIIFDTKVQRFNIEQIYFKTGHNSIGEVKYDTIINKGFYFMDTCEKSWKNYYTHYNNKIYENDIILKCDDDIVFIDLHKLPDFINFIKNNDYDLVFANTINNGVSAYYQQTKYKLIPKNLMDLELPGCYGGTLWESGQKAEILHNFFIENNKLFIENDFNNEHIQINGRYSINFFGYKGKNWNKIQHCHTDDEYNLTVNYVKNNNFKNILYFNFCVSHLSFYRQVETGINLTDLINKYNKLYDKLYDKLH